MTVDMKKVEKVAEKEYQDIISDYANVYGMWINVLWDLDNGELETVEEKREAFLLLLKKLIDAGLVKVFRPDYDFSELFNPTKPMKEQEHMFWHAPSEEIIEWYRKNFPKGIKDPDDMEINLFFHLDYYKCPPIIWKDPETGMWLGS